MRLCHNRREAKTTQITASQLKQTHVKKLLSFKVWLKPLKNSKQNISMIGLKWRA